MTALRPIGVALLLLVAALTPAGAAERIVQFLSDVQVERNGDLQVAESLGVQAEDIQIRHGILRDFPTVYHRRDGTRVEVGFDVAAVTLDGAAEPYATEKLSNGVRVRIGSAGKYVSPGLHAYAITYRTTRQIGFRPEFDELYWNVTGSGWTLPITQAEAHITLPRAVPFVQRAFYTGPAGGNGQDATVVEEKPGRMVFRTTKPLPAHNALTVAAAWEKGVVAPPTGTQQLAWMFQDDPALTYAALGIAVMLYYFGAWLLVGRDPPRGTIIPLFAPPAGMSAAAVRFVENEGMDNRVFTAGIIGLGVNGRLKLSGKGAAGQITRRDGGKPIDAAEAALAKSLFAGKTAVRLDRSDHDRLAGAKLSLWRTLDEQYRGTLFLNNAAWSFLGFFASAGITAAIGHALLSTYGNPNGPIMVLAMAFPTLVLMAAAVLIRNGWQRVRHGWALMLAGLVLAAVALGIGLWVLTAQVGTGIALVPAVVPYLMAPFAALGFRWLKARSKAGRDIADQIEGFRQYLGVAEESRLEALNPPQKTPELFERFLPYAIALDVQNTWAKRFAGVLATAATGAAIASWYSGDRNIVSDSVSFTDHLDRFSDTIAAASTAPGSTDSGSSSDSGSSGGGSSDGGGGGGGGSGW
jgi:uncharacterized membrane protein YgcG